MKKLLALITIFSLMTIPAQSAEKWRNGTGEETLLGTETVSDIDASLNQHVVEPLDRLLFNYRQEAQLKYNSVSTIDITAGEVACQNSSDVTRMRRVTADLTLTWADIDSGAEASSTTYYVYADCDADATTFVGVISTNSTTPSGITYYKRLGSFTNDSGSDITAVENDDERVKIVSGTIADAATISLPSGWSNDECSFIVSINSVNGGTSSGGAFARVSSTVSSARVVNCDGTKYNWVDGASTSTITGTCNYLGVCTR